MSAQGLERGERATVEKDGEELEVWDHVSVSTHHYVNSINGYETFDPDIYEGDMGGHGPTPEAVTERVADVLHTEFHIDLWDRDDIEVVDMSSDDVKRL